MLRLVEVDLIIVLLHSIFLSVKRIKSFNLQITHHHIGDKLRQQRKDSYSDGEWLYQEEIIVSLFFTYRIVAISEINIS